MGFDEIQICTYYGVLITPSRWKFVRVKSLSQLIQKRETCETSESCQGLLSIIWSVAIWAGGIIIQRNNQIFWIKRGMDKRISRGEIKVRHTLVERSKEHG